MTIPLSKELAQQAVDLLAKHKGIKANAAKEAGLHYATYRDRLLAAERMGITVPTKGIAKHDDPAELNRQIKHLQTELTKLTERSITEEAIRRKIVNLNDAVAISAPPPWMSADPKKHTSPGVPTLFCSDWHTGEVVNPSQINHVNDFSMTIFRQRVNTLTESAIDLLRILSPKLEYPGIVCVLGGDMISGNIHDELTATNELNTMPTVLELYGVLVGMIGRLADTFGKVFLPCVTGNHGRDTVKIWNKDRHATSFDWLLYSFLAKHFESDKRVTFYIPDGPDAYYRVYSHRYLLTHGDQFRGGDGMIGALGPIMRGDHKKRSRNAQIDMEYDTIIMGHWHQAIFLRKLIVNSSLKGYDEYAYNNNFSFEPPSQWLWVTHPKHGKTFSAPVYVDASKKAPLTDWVSFPRRVKNG